jgi:hypothetical protein
MPFKKAITNAYKEENLKNVEIYGTMFKLLTEKSLL